MSGPFVYTDELDTILGSERSLRKILVFGAPAMGKTTLIEAVAARRPEGCELVRARRRDPEVVRYIVGWANDPERRSKDLLIDDIDHMFSVEVEHAFRNLPDGDADGLGRIIATSGTPHKWLERQGAPPDDPARADLNILVHDSTALNSFHHMWLDPWGHVWQTSTTLRVQTALKRKLDEFGGRLTELATRPGRREFAAMLVEVSDGHPALLGAGFSWLIQRLERRAWKRAQGGAHDSGLDLPERTATGLAQRLAGELVESQLERIGRAVDWARAQSPAAVRELMEMATEGVPRKMLTERALLTRSGLVRRVDSGGWDIAGDTIRQCVLRQNERMPEPRTGGPFLAESSAPPPAAAAAPIAAEPVLLVPDPRVPRAQGKLSWTSRGVARELSITGAAWAILLELAAADGALVTVPDICERVGQESQKAVRSALQRLLHDLRNSGLDGLVVNVRRKGYLFDAGFRPDEAARSH